MASFSIPDQTWQRCAHPTYSTLCGTGHPDGGESRSDKGQHCHFIIINFLRLWVQTRISRLHKHSSKPNWLLSRCGPPKPRWFGPLDRRKRRHLPSSQWRMLLLCQLI
jgi:hypothetical protein